MLAIFCTTNTFAQNTPTYPQPKEGFKRVDLIFPKIENSNNYKVEVRFGMETELYPCSKAGFNFKFDALVKGYGIKNERFPYYDLTTNQAEVLKDLWMTVAKRRRELKEKFLVMNRYY